MTLTIDIEIRINRMESRVSDPTSLTDIDHINQKEQQYVCQYLESHPLFAQQWFRHHLSAQYDSDGNVSQMSRDNETIDSQQQLSNQCLNNTSIDRQISDAKHKQTEDEELLTASYAEMAREGRNSVTSDLFRDIVVNGRKKSNSSNVAGAFIAASITDP